MVDFSEAGLKAYSLAMLVLFCVALAATVVAHRTPTTSGLALVVTGGLSIALAVYGIVAWLFGGLFVVPFGFLILVAGVILITRAQADRATA